MACPFVKHMPRATPECKHPRQRKPPVCPICPTYPFYYVPYIPPPKPKVISLRTPCITPSYCPRKCCVHKPHPMACKYQCFGLPCKAHCYEVW